MGKAHEKYFSVYEVMVTLGVDEWNARNELDKVQKAIFSVLNRMLDGD